MRVEPTSHPCESATRRGVYIASALVFASALTLWRLEKIQGVTAGALGSLAVGAATITALWKTTQERFEEPPGPLPPLKPSRPALLRNLLERGELAPELENHFSFTWEELVEAGCTLEKLPDLVSALPQLAMLELPEEEEQKLWELPQVRLLFWQMDAGCELEGGEILQLLRRVPKPTPSFCVGWGSVWEGRLPHVQYNKPPTPRTSKESSLDAEMKAIYEGKRPETTELAQLESLTLHKTRFGYQRWSLAQLANLLDHTPNLKHLDFSFSPPKDPAFSPKLFARLAEIESLHLPQKFERLIAEHTGQKLAAHQTLDEFEETLLRKLRIFLSGDWPPGTDWVAALGRCSSATRIIFSLPAESYTDKLIEALSKRQGVDLGESASPLLAKHLNDPTLAPLVGKMVHILDWSQMPKGLTYERAAQLCPHLKELRLIYNADMPPLKELPPADQLTLGGAALTDEVLADLDPKRHGALLLHNATSLTQAGFQTLCNKKFPTLTFRGAPNAPPTWQEKEERPAWIPDALPLLQAHYALFLHGNRYFLDYDPNPAYKALKPPFTWEWLIDENKGALLFRRWAYGGHLKLTLK